MSELGAEERLLRRALELGLLRAEDVAAAQGPSGEPGSYRWGPRLDRLIAQGRVDEAAVRRLASEGPPLAQTLAGSIPGARPDAQAEHEAGGAREGALALARTLHSGAPEGAVVSVVSSVSFPVPHWERYEFLALLGRGGMGAVYRARDRRLGRMVALKFILGKDPGTVQRFLQEARSQARLDHPCICRVFEVGFVDEKPYIALELIEGTTLDRASLSLTEKIQVFREVAEAMDHAHRQGVIHRDVKPSTVPIERN
ncbi:MAG: serine/threonine-protein kinase [Polyangia bacterium]